MDRLFLGATVLYSAAYRPGAGLRRLWEIPGVRLVSSLYAAEEARRNLKGPEQREDLESLLASMEIAGESASRAVHPVFDTVTLPEKDRPILLAAIDARATHLITGDFTHFGPYYGKSIGGVTVLPPAWYLKGPADPES